MKKILSVILSICMLLSITAGLDLTAYAEVYSGSCGANVTWSLDTDTLRITGTGDMKDYDYGEAPWYSYNSSIKKVSIDNGVTSIGKYAFYKCSNLSSITIGNSVTSIGYAAFSDCNNLTSVTIPDSVTTLGSSALCACTSLTTVTLPNNITSIDEYMFWDCTSLTTITIPNSVTSIGKYAFYNCPNLTNIYYTGTEEDWSNILIAGNNDGLTNATVTYIESEPDPEPEPDPTPAHTHSYKAVVTKATLSADGKIEMKCTCGDIKSTTVIAKPKTIKLSAKSYVYNGKAKKPTVTVKDSKGNKIDASNYTVSYAKGRKNVGKYKVTVTFKNNYSGTKTLYFTIKPKATSISKLTAGKKAFTVKWKKQTKQVTGYEIQYSTSKKFTKKTTKKSIVKSNKKTSATIKKLKSGKKYFVRIRTYKTVKVNGKSTKIYSKWSKVKTVKIK